MEFPTLAFTRVSKRLSSLVQSRKHGASLGARSNDVGKTGSKSKTHVGRVELPGLGDFARHFQSEERSVGSRDSLGSFPAGTAAAAAP